MAETIKAIREMEEDFGQPPMDLADVNIEDYYDWLISGYGLHNHHAETPDF